MSVPEGLTSLKADDILLAGESDEYREGDKASLVGHLKELFLFGGRLDQLEYLDITDADRKDYRKACDILRREAGWNVRVSKDELPDGDLHELEETVTRKRAASLINKTVKEFLNGRSKRKDKAKGK